MATLHEDPTTFTDLTVTTLTLSAAPTTPATAPGTVRYVSQAITHADLTAGVASCTVNLNNFPNGAVVTAAYAVTSVATTSSSGNTTGLSMKLGIVGVIDDAFLTNTSIFGAASRKLAAPGSLVNGYVAGTPQVTFTATGGTPNCAHINALAIKFVIYYHLPVTE